MDSGNIYAIPAVISSILYIILISLIFKKDHKTMLSRISMLFFVLLFVWSFSEWMLRWSDTHDSAFLWAYSLFIPIILLPPVLIHLSLVFPWSKTDIHPAIYGLYALSLILLAMHINSGFFIDDVILYSAGYGTILGPYGLFVYVYLAVTGLIAILILMKKYASIRSKLALHQVKMLIIALSSSYILIFFTGLFPYLYGNPYEYPLTSISFSICGMIIIFSIYRYHIFRPELKEEFGKKAMECRGIKVLPREEAMDEFYVKVSSGNKGICITAKDPQETKEEMGIRKVPVIHVKEISEKIDVKTPKGRSFIPFIVNDSLMNKNAIVLLDGFDQIFPKDEFRDFIEDMRYMEPQNGMVIISMDEKADNFKNNGPARI